jgi:hypothetical protein
MLRTDDERRQHPYCIRCKESAEKAGKDWGAITSHCKGIYSDEDFELLAEKTDLSVAEIKEVKDPSTWILHNLALDPHWYQDVSVKCTSARQALRWGRRTGKTHICAAKFLYLCNTRPGIKILAVTPWKSQAREIRERIKEFIDNNKKLQAELVSSVQQPYYEFLWKNGSRIRIFVGGSSGGENAAGQVRGQEADLIFMDEMDYLDDDSSNAISPILTDPSRQGREEIELIVSSTPSGKEGLFFTMCNDEHYMELHIPSRFRPDWNTHREQQARKSCKNQQEFDHEYDAKWGTKADGVFRRSDVIKAQQPYRYHRYDGIFEEIDWPEMSPWLHWVYMMGVDWNGEGNGTRIVVIGYDPTRDNWSIVHRERVDVEEFALHTAVDRVVKLNRIWNCHSLYIDWGFGAYQDEVLRGIGRAAHNAKNAGQQYHTADLTLADHVRAIDFGSTFTYNVTDPDTKEIKEVKKPLKNYMVENLQRHFELGSLGFSKADGELKQQFMGYFVKGKSKHHELVYKADPEAGDHDLDAVVLAMFAFNREFDPFFKKNYVDTIEVMARPGQAAQDDGAPNPYTHPREYDQWIQNRKKTPEPRQRGHNVPSRTIKPAEQKQQIEPGVAVFTMQRPQTRSLAPQFRGPPSRTSWRHGTGGRSFGKR